VLVGAGGAWAGGAAIILMVVMAGPANAAEPAPVFDDGTTHPGFNYVPDVQPDWKLELVDLHEQAKAGKMSAAGAARFNAIIRDKGIDPTGSVADATASVQGLVTPMAAVSKSLTVTQSPQSKSWWCGPASAGSVIHSWHNEKNWSTVSAYDGHSLSQTWLAGYHYTQAGTALDDPDQPWAGGTNWDEKDMTRALNHWLFDDDTNYVQWSPDTVANLESKVTLDIDVEWMIASDMYEKASGPHYNHHPVDKLIAHWTTIYGFAASGDTFRFQDPAANSPALNSSWDAVLPTFTMSSTSTFNYMTKQGVTRGIAW
jgi:hypothetical protein